MSELEEREKAVARKREELEELKAIVAAEKRKIKVCKLCLRKFANAEHLRRHEQGSALHRENQGE